MTLDLAILASGSGSNAQAIMDKVACGALDARIRVIISNNPDAGVLERARRAGLPCEIIDHRAFADRKAFDASLADAVRGSGADFVALAGFMRMLGSEFLQAFPQRVVNLHPALLPSFPGVRGGADALAYGVKISGCSVHFVEEKMDSGPLIIQAAVPVSAGEGLEELMARIHSMEHRIYPQALQWLAQGRISVSGRMVSLAPGSAPLLRQDGPWLIWPPLEEAFY